MRQRPPSNHGLSLAPSTMFTPSRSESSTLTPLMAESPEVKSVARWPRLQGGAAVGSTIPNKTHWRNTPYSLPSRFLNLPDIATGNLAPRRKPLTLPPEDLKICKKVMKSWMSPFFHENNLSAGTCQIECSNSRIAPPLVTTSPAIHFLPTASEIRLSAFVSARTT